MKKNILVVGGTSFLGKNILQEFNKDSEMNVQFTSRAAGIPLDLSAKNNYLQLFEKYNFDVILWVAAIKDVKWCEANKDLAHQINYQSLKDCYQQMQQTKNPPRFIFISSDYVFDGKNGNYQYSSETHPVTYYGELKVKAEQFLKAQNKNDVTVRTASLCGDQSVFLNWLISQLKEDKKFFMFENSYLTPTSVTYFSKVMKDLVFENKPIEKILHVCGEQSYSRYAFALKLKQSFPDLFKAEVLPELASGHLSQNLSLVASYFGQQGEHQFKFLLEEVQKCIKL